MGAEARNDAVSKSRRAVPGERPASAANAEGAARKQNDVLRPPLIKSVNQLWLQRGVA